MSIMGVDYLGCAGNAAAEMEVEPPVVAGLINPSVSTVKCS